MILVQSIADRIKADLDAEGSDYYKFDQDIKPAINQSIEWLCTVFDSIFGTKKVVPYQLKELIFVKVWQANKYSRVSFNPSAVGHELWSILSVMPLPDLHPSNSLAPLSNPVQSVFMPNKTFISGNFSAKRLSTEEWALNTKNPFVEGNIVMNNGLREYGYKDFADYSSSSYSNPVGAEIEIRPSIAGKYVAIEYIKYPKQVSLITDSIEFPSSMIQIITEKALQYIAYKQGDGTSIWAITNQDINRIVGLFS